MDSRRLAYLRALDIEVWERRELLRAAEEPSVDHVAMPVNTGVADISVGRPRAIEAPLARAAQTGVQPSSMAHVENLDWDALVATVKECQRCPLHQTRTQSVFGVGNPRAQWLVIGEAPGAEEDRQGEPFVGRAGQLLNSMLKAIGLAREEVFIANILKSRPPNNRDPRPDEVRECIPFLYRQIELINPRLILCVGRIAAQTLLGTDTPIGKLRGKLHHFAPAHPAAKTRPMIVTYHPAYLLRSPAEKRKAWGDLVLAMQTFEQLGAPVRER
jgi:DNA polymerase